VDAKEFGNVLGSKESGVSTSFAICCWKVNFSRKGLVQLNSTADPAWLKAWRIISCYDARDIVTMATPFMQHTH
jgi:hypothetical protein